MALMAFVPELAVVIAPLLISYNSVPAVDRLKTESDRGTLTLADAATSVGEIALNVLPFVGRAKAFSKTWALIEGANWGGQAVLMTASALQIAHELQSQDVAALAALYEDLKKAEESGAAPAELEQKREKVMERAKEVSDRIAEALRRITRNAIFAVAGSVIHNAGTEQQNGSIMDAYSKARGIAGGEGEAKGAGIDDNNASANAAAPTGDGGHAAAGEPATGVVTPSQSSHVDSNGPSAVGHSGQGSAHEDATAEPPRPAEMPASVEEVRARKAAGETWTNKQVRDSYNARNHQVAELNEQWKQQGLMAEQRARKAYALRHDARMTAREMMGSDPQKLRILIRDAKTYGDGGGPGFDELVAQQRAKGLNGDAAYEAIIVSSQRTDGATNKRVAAGEAHVPSVELPPGTVIHGDGVTLLATNGKELRFRVRASPEGARTNDAKAGAEHSRFWSERTCRTKLRSTRSHGL